MSIGVCIKCKSVVVKVVTIVFYSVGSLSHHTSLPLGRRQSVQAIAGGVLTAAIYLGASWTLRTSGSAHKVSIKTTTLFTLYYHWMWTFSSDSIAIYHIATKRHFLVTRFIAKSIYLMRVSRSGTSQLMNFGLRWTSNRHFHVLAQLYSRGYCFLTARRTTNIFMKFLFLSPKSSSATMRAP